MRERERESTPVQHLPLSHNTRRYLSPVPRSLCTIDSSSSTGSHLFAEASANASRNISTHHVDTPAPAPAGGGAAAHTSSQPRPVLRWSRLARARRQYGRRPPPTEPAWTGTTTAKQQHGALSRLAPWRELRDAQGRNRHAEPRPLRTRPPNPRLSAGEPHTAVVTVRRAAKEESPFDLSSDSPIGGILCIQRSLKDIQVSYTAVKGPGLPVRGTLYSVHDRYPTASFATARQVNMHTAVRY